MTTSSDRHGPIRTCVGCRAKRPQDELVRCVLDAHGTAHVDRHGPGRGAWLCGPDCLDAARTRRGFTRAWRREVRPDALDGLADELKRVRTTGWGTPPVVRD